MRYTTNAKEQLADLTALIAEITRITRIAGATRDAPELVRHPSNRALVARHADEALDHIRAADLDALERIAADLGDLLRAGGDGRAVGAYREVRGGLALDRLAEQRPYAGRACARAEDALAAMSEAVHAEQPLDEDACTEQ